MYLPIHWSGIDIYHRIEREEVHSPRTGSGSFKWLYTYCNSICSFPVKVVSSQRPALSAVSVRANGRSSLIAAR